MIAVALAFFIGTIFGAFAIVILIIAIEDLEKKKDGPTGPGNMKNESPEREVHFN